METEEYLTSSEAAAIIGVHRSRIAQLCQQDDGIPHITVGSGAKKAYLIRRDVAEEWRKRMARDSEGKRGRGRPKGAKDGKPRGLKKIAAPSE